jgi:hypothetical protein
VLSAGERNSDSASGAPGVSSAGERNGRFSKWRGGQGVEKREKRAIQRAARRACYPREKETAIQQAARRACRRREKETSDSGRGAPCVSSAGERNTRFSKCRGGQGVG